MVLRISDSSVPGSSLLELKQRIGFYASLNPDCTATGDVNVRVTRHLF